MPWTVSIEGTGCIRRLYGVVTVHDFEASRVAMTEHPNADNVRWMVDDSLDAADVVLDQRDAALQMVTIGLRMFRYVRRWAVVGRAGSSAEQAFRLFEAAPTPGGKALTAFFTDLDTATRWARGSD